MSRTWHVLATRARGLAGHLLGPDELAVLGRTVDRTGLLRILRESPYGSYLTASDTAAPALERAVSRSVEARLALLARWAGDDAAMLSPLLRTLDARNLRAVLRGVVAGVAEDRVLEATIPTPALDRPALATLVRAESLDSLVGTLTLWGSPFAPSLGAESRRGVPDLFRLEAALGRGMGDALGEDLRGTDGPMRAFVSDEIDAWNVEAALALPGARTEADPGELFLVGGRALTREGFLGAVEKEDRAACLQALARAVRDRDLARALGDGPSDGASVARRIVDERVDRARRATSLDPLTSAPVAAFVLRLRREVRVVRRAIWGADAISRRAA